MSEHWQNLRIHGEFTWTRTFSEIRPGAWKILCILLGRMNFDSGKVKIAMAELGGYAGMSRAAANRWLRHLKVVPTHDKQWILKVVKSGRGNREASIFEVNQQLFFRRVINDPSEMSNFIVQRNQKRAVELAKNDKSEGAISTLPIGQIKPIRKVSSAPSNGSKAAHLNSMVNSFNNQDIPPARAPLSIPPPARALIPSLEEVTLFALGRRKHETWAKEFFKFNESNGWRIGDKPIADWKGAFMAWAKKKEAKMRVNPAKRSTAPLSGLLKNEEPPRAKSRARN